MTKSKLIGKIANVIAQNKSTILTCLEVTGVIATAVLSSQAAVKAHKALEEGAEAKEDGHLSPKEVALIALPIYIPAAAAGIGTIGCCLFHNYVSLKDAATLLAAYHISENQLSEFKNAAIRTVGEKKTEEITDNVAFASLKDDPIDSKTIIFTGKGEHLCYDATSKDYFKTDIEKVRQAVNNINAKLNIGDTVTINDFHDELGDNFPYWETGDQLGWDLNYNRRLLEVTFSSQIASDGSPCLVLLYQAYPIGYIDY